MTRGWLWTIVLVLVACILFGVHACGSEDVARRAIAASTSPATDRTNASDAAAEVANAARLALIARHDDAMRAAVARLHQYLALLGGEDRAKADAFWVDGRVPARSGEADLRRLHDLRAMRSENGTPVALDKDDVPGALQIPVDLRVSVGKGPLRRYRGWYRMRRAVADDRWEITSASIDALPATQ